MLTNISLVVATADSKNRV